MTQRPLWPEPDTQACGMPPSNGTIEREEAIARVEENADLLWRAAALAAVYVTAVTHDELTTDDVPLPGVTTHELRAWGAIMRQAQVAGWIVASDRHRLSSRAACHRRPKRVWLSRIYRADVAQTGEQLPRKE